MSLPSEATVLSIRWFLSGWPEVHVEVYVRYMLGTCFPNIYRASNPDVQRGFRELEVYVYKK